jgi:arginase
MTPASGRARRIQIIGVPVDLGAGRRGVDMGPSAVRVAGIEAKLESLGYEVEDAGDLAVSIPERSAVGSERLRYKAPIVELSGRLATAVRAALASGATPLVIGGDHSLAIGTVAGSAGYFAERGQSIGVIWIDAHGDMNTPETTPSGNIHGMSLAISLGLGDVDLTSLGGRSPKVRPENAVLIGARDLDAGERENMRSSGMHVFTMRQLDELGVRRVMELAIEAAGGGTAGIHVSFDMDSLDPDFAPGTGTPVIGGLSYREAHLAMEVLADHGRVVALDLVEINPVLDVRNETAELGVELIMSALGKRIY